ncbi:MAG: hypothetical protein MAG795_00045 [Candidatus Woesearchaeota archaeon]|nr:hypothetical protein [Candidatus Woesearchaeota archaeon]
MAEEVSNRVLASVLIVAVVVSLVGTIISLSRLAKVGVPDILGYALDTHTATASVQIMSTASIRFQIDTLDFGTGMVNTSGGNTNCSLATGDTTGVRDGQNRCINFSVASNLTSLEIENDGLNNMTINLTFDTNATDYVGGGDSQQEEFRFNISENESGSCINLSNTQNVDFPAENWTHINTSMFWVCAPPGLTFEDTIDSLDLHLNLTIPYDSIYAGEGVQTCTITATASTYLGGQSW